MSTEKKSQVDTTPDLYAYLEEDNNNIMETPRKVSSREKKLKVLQNKLGELNSQAQNGFLMGAAVGGSMGALIGIWSALQYRKLILLPISIISSGGFFGFMMMCGSLIRTDTENIYKNNQLYNQNSSLNTMGDNAFWKVKYASSNVSSTTI